MGRHWWEDSPETLRRMTELHLSGESMARLSRTFGIPPREVRKVIESQGILPRSANEPVVPTESQFRARLTEVRSRLGPLGSLLERRRRVAANPDEWREAFRKADTEVDGMAHDRDWPLWEREADAADMDRPLVGGFVPRAFQVEAKQAVMKDFADGYSRCLCVSPTGTGKTELGFLIGQQFERRLMAFPTIELTHQTMKRAQKRWPDATVDLEQGPSKAGGGSNTICASMQSLLSRKRYERFLGKVDVVMVDEAHWGFTATQHAMLDRFVEGGSKIVGLTATPFVTNRGGILSWWQRVSYQYSIRQATDDGLLVPSTVTQLRCTEMDLSAFKPGENSDYNAIELDKILNREKVALEMSDAVAQHYGGRCSIVFAHSIAQAAKVREILSVRYRIRTGLVHSKMDTEERQGQMDAFFAGDIPIMVNVGVLILGFDWPAVRNVFMLKPTASRARYMQMFGRGTRPLPGVIDNPVWGPSERRAAIAASEKPAFHVYDLTDNCRSHTLCSALDVLSPETTDEVKTRVKRRLEGRKEVDTATVDEILAEEVAEEGRRLAAIERLEAQRREKLRARGLFEGVERDPYAPPEKKKYSGSRAYMPFGKYKGRPISAIETRYLEYISANYKLTGWVQQAVTNELTQRAERSRQYAGRSRATSGGSWAG